jgi:hypothetical protein
MVSWCRCSYSVGVSMPRLFKRSSQRCAKGDVAEVNWHAALDGRHGREGFLPGRYAVSSAYVIDAEGNRSDQIDLVVHDAHFCPLLFKQAGHRYIPAESVYAVFEVKPELNRDYVLYAGEKADGQMVRAAVSSGFRCRSVGSLIFWRLFWRHRRAGSSGVGSVVGVALLVVAVGGYGRKSAPI